ncbi:Growth-regulating factor 8 [Hibiscus syriacus]|uniref:Growth-regulating factor n=1 Tax=Hibiscus syriacus TaxID=106335 RepID=A0A6A2ZMX6_HIBSY|nr:Growth-regulating factor 8 [Hibiscus syriacus]
MDFGVLGLEGIVGPDNGAPSLQTRTFLSIESKPMIVGSGFTKQERSSDSAEEDHWKNCKLPRTDDLSTPKTMSLLHQGSPLLRSNSLVITEACQQDHMVNFSLLKSEVPSIGKDDSFLETSTQNSNFSYYQHTPSMYTRNAGYGSGSLNEGMHGNFTGVEGPFTLSQWNELKYQALIYKYITSNVPVPSNFLIPLKKSLYPYGFTSSSAGSFPLGWGSFHLRYTGNTDPEPGRCRRTDGKKWRCSRDAVADQKYCERHINRGRHRSRKPVEGQIGHAATGTTNSKEVPMSSSVSESVKTRGGAANSLAIAWQHQFKNLQSGAADPSPDTLVNRIQDRRRLPVFSTTNLKESAFTITKQGVPFAEAFPSDFGHVASDSLINPSHKSSYMDSKEFGLLLDFTGQETQNHTPPHQFIDGWLKDEFNHSSITWPGELKSDRTQLSMSIPMAKSEFSLSSSSPAKEKLDLSSLRLSREFDPIQMGLEMSIDMTDQSKKQANRVPMSWGSSMGGPLGEVLNYTANNVDTVKQLGSSPAVLQKAPFCSLSNSSSRSSPIAENKKLHDGASVGDNAFRSTLVSAASVPSTIRN